MILRKYILHHLHLSKCSLFMSLESQVSSYAFCQVWSGELCICWKRLFIFLPCFGAFQPFTLTFLAYYFNLWRTDKCEIIAEYLGIFLTKENATNSPLAHEYPSCMQIHTYQNQSVIQCHIWTYSQNLFSKSFCNHKRKL